MFCLLGIKMNTMLCRISQSMNGLADNVIRAAAKSKTKKTPAPKAPNVKVNPFDYLENNNNTAGGSKSGTFILRDLVSSFWGTIMIVGAIGLIVSIMYCGIRLAIFPNDAPEVKKHFMVKCGIFILLCGGTFFFGMVLTVAKTLIE